MALELHGADERVGGSIFVIALLAGCPGGQAQPKLPPPASSEPHASGVSVTNSEGEGPSGAHDTPALFAPHAACDGGFDVPAFDPAGARWWSSLTHEQRDALVGTGAANHWSAVSQSPIVLHRGESSLVLRSVDGCWRQELNAERPSRLLVDGPAGVAWEFSKDRVRLLDLLAPGTPIVVAEGVTAGDLAITGGEGAALLTWSSDISLASADRPKPATTLVVEWSATPSLELRNNRGDASAATPPFAPGAEQWLKTQHARNVPGARVTRLDLSARAEPESPSTPGSRCKDPAVCLGAAPFGASALELVRYGEIDITRRDDTAMGPLCAVFEPSTGTWYEDATLAVTRPNPRDFTEDQTPCEGGWVFDITGRAYLRQGQVCVGSRCSRVEGEPLGFVRGNVLIAG